MKSQMWAHTEERHSRLGGPMLSPRALLRVAGLFPLDKGLDSSSMGLGESLLRDRKATGDAPSP